MQSSNMMCHNWIVQANEERTENHVGARLVQTVIQRWGPHLSDRAYRVLVAMALTALDNDKGDRLAGLYFGGHDNLILGLQRKGGSKPESAVRTVRRAIDELIEIGAVRLTSKAFLGGNASYELTLNNAPKIYKRNNSESKGVHFKEDTGCPTGPDTRCPTGEDKQCPAWPDTQCPTYKEPLEEPLEELSEEYGSDLVAELAVVAPPDAKEEPNSISSPCGNADCFDINGIRYIPNPQKTKGNRNIRCPTCNPAPNVLDFRGRRTA